jgi:hypothetical protein
VLWWRLRLHLDGFGGSGPLHAEPGGWVRAGLAPVSLHSLPCGALLAASDQALLLTARPGGRLAAARVHGGDGLAAACALSVPELPGSSLAYVRDGQLHLGCLDPTPRLRWDQLALSGGAAPASAAYHPATGLAAVAAWGSGGACSLRLVDAAAMRELGQLPLPPGHSVTATAVLPLPCSSRWDQAPPLAATAADAALEPCADGGQGEAAEEAPAGCRHFLLVASAGGGAAPPPCPGAEGEDGAPDPLPPTCDDGQPWWRQQPCPARRGAQHDGGAAQPAALLSVYEVRRGAAPAAAAPTGCSWTGGSRSGDGAHQLLLHGAGPLPATAVSLAAVEAAAEPLHAPPTDTAPATTGGSAASAHGAATPAAQRLPLLAAGCQDGTVRLFRCGGAWGAPMRGKRGGGASKARGCSVTCAARCAAPTRPAAAAVPPRRLFVDDAGSEARDALQHGLAAIKDAVQALSLTGPGPPREAGPEARHQGAGGGGSPGPSPRTTPAAAPAPSLAGGRWSSLWHGRVALQLLSEVRPPLPAGQQHACGRLRHPA